METFADHCRCQAAVGVINGGRKGLCSEDRTEERRLPFQGRIGEAWRSLKVAFLFLTNLGLVAPMSSAIPTSKAHHLSSADLDLDVVFGRGELRAPLGSMLCWRILRS